MPRHLCIVMLPLFHLLRPLYLHTRLEKLGHPVKTAMHLNHTNEEEENKFQSIEHISKQRKKTFNIHQIRWMTFFRSMEFVKTVFQ